MVFLWFSYGYQPYGQSILISLKIFPIFSYHLRQPGGGRASSPAVGSFRHARTHQALRATGTGRTGEVIEVDMRLYSGFTH